jgi:hypothetical protein
MSIFNIDFKVLTDYRDHVGWVYPVPTSAPASFMAVNDRSSNLGVDRILLWPSQEI